MLTSSRPTSRLAQFGPNFAFRLGARYVVGDLNDSVYFPIFISVYSRPELAELWQHLLLAL